MFELLGAQNFGMLLQNISLFASSIALAELYDRLNIKTMFTLQRGADRIRKNVLGASKKMVKKGSSGFVLNFGKRVLNLHHSRVGFALMFASAVFSNFSLLVFSVGLVLHHAMREKKIF